MIWRYFFVILNITIAVNGPKVCDHCSSPVTPLTSSVDACAIPSVVGETHSNTKLGQSDRDEII